MCVISLFLRMTRRSSIAENLLSANFRRDIRNSRDLKRPIDSESCFLLDDTLIAGTFKRHMLAAKKREEILTKDGGS